MTEVEKLWAHYLDSLPKEAPKPARYYEAFAFGTSPESATELAALVKAGIKTATSSLAWSYEHDRKPLPRPGDLSIVLDGGGTPVCLIETTEIRIIPFSQVDPQFAFDGGEDDRSLESWREGYWTYIIAECNRIGRSPTPDVPMVCERFRLVDSNPS